MTVYIVVNVWAGGEITKVFSSMEKAEAYVANECSNGDDYKNGDGYDIEEWNVDEEFNAKSVDHSSNENLCPSQPNETIGEAVHQIIEKLVAESAGSALTMPQHVVNGLQDALKVTAATGLIVNYNAGSVTLQDGSVVTIAAGQISLSHSFSVD